MRRNHTPRRIAALERHLDRADRTDRVTRRRRRVSRSVSRDAEPSCQIRLYVGSGIPGDAGRYRGLPAAFDSQVFLDTVTRLVGEVFPGATFFKTRGVWEGAGEDGLMVEVLASPVSGSCSQAFGRARLVAERLASTLGQQAVFLVTTDAEGRRAQDLVEAA